MSRAMERFEGRVALVTGAGSGIGAAIAQRLHAEGAKIVLVDRHLQAAQALADSLGQRALALQADVADAAQVQQSLAAAVAHFGAIHIGVNAAGFGALAPLLDMEVAAWNNLQQVVLGGVFISTQAQARQFVRQGGGGVIVNIASTNAVQPAAGMSAYCSAKAGVAMFTRVAAMELAEHGVRVVGVGPGLTETPATKAFFDAPGIKSAFLANIPAERAARAEEVAGMVAYLASDEAGYVTGETFYIEGGLLTRSYPRLTPRQPSTSPTGANT